MKKRLIAAVLSIVMLLFALPIYASAASNPLDPYLRTSLTGIVNISYNLKISGDAKIYKGYTVNILPGATLTLEENVKLTVEGTLNNFGDIVLKKEAKIEEASSDSYRTYSAADWYYQYQFLYGYGYGYGNNTDYIYVPGYGYIPSNLYPWIGYENLPGSNLWPIFMPTLPTGDNTDISNYYYYLLYLYNQGLIDKDDWDNLYKYIYYYGYYTPVTYTCEAPTANIKSGTTVDFGTAVTLSTSTKDATIYYTTDGSTPDTTDNVYTGPIKLNKAEMTIKAIAVKSGYKDSPVATFTYKTKSSISFTDLGTHAETLTPSLVTLVQAKIISDGSTLNPEGSVSYDELITWLKAVGINTGKASINEEYITDKNALTYEDFAYICYRVLLNAPKSVVLTPKQSAKVVLGQLKYGDSVTANPSMVRAGVMSLVEANLFYRLDFHPKATVTRAYAFYMLAEVYNKIN